MIARDKILPWLACIGFSMALITSCTSSLKNLTAQESNQASTTPTVPMGNGNIDLDLSLDGGLITKEAATQYVNNAAQAVTAYFGRFPVPRVKIDVSISGDGTDVHGKEFDGNRVTLEFGRMAKDSDIAGDWVATHELFHLAYPDLGDNYKWMNEGLSDYLEPISRARIGKLTPEKVWRDFYEGMPQGQPEAGDQGLDNTHTWGRTYWGGCIYWLLADVRIREKTHNRKSLDDALRAILAAGGDGRVTWELARVITIGDAATGTTVLRDLHDELGGKSVKVDLDALWSQLGVSVRNGVIYFDDRAPLSYVRKGITGSVSGR